jgi:hypothetical protein
LIDATAIGSAAKRDKEAAWVRHRTRAPAHGFKAHIAADKDTGIIREVETTPANEPDVAIAPSIVPEEPGEVYADKAYDALAVEKAIEAKGGTSRSMRRAIAGCPPNGSKRIIARCARSGRESRKSSEPGSAAAIFAVCDGSGSPRPNCSRDRLQHQTLLAAANRLSGFEKSGAASPASQQGPQPRRHLAVQPTIFRRFSSRNDPKAPSQT